MLKVGIIGASGYTGVELARILSTHPEVELTVATSRQYAGKPLAEVFPNLRKRVDLVCENLGPEELVDRADFFFAAVPHKTAMDLVPILLKAGKKVVDLSADFRIRDAAVYEEWYQPHSSIECIEEAVYGLPELYRDQVKNARLTANPGCYPTSIILGLAPLLREGLIDPAHLIIDSKSGTSGAGRSANVGTLFCEVTDGFRAYKVGGQHRHIPEIEQELTVLAGQPVTISFTPHLLPISRGILSTMYAPLSNEISATTETEIQELYESTYTDEPFVRVCPAGSFPATQHVRGSNCCDIGIKVDVRTGRIIIVSAIDNVAKGASGQAVQNMNLMNGFDETCALMGAPFFP
ncbi:MAG: N-acetyl-gamma-glutamyl-phosphate reductase [Candidatus Electrothrix sp. AW3_4]|nr:N-acetyl-gamma-glutamyl-phosphate reductase [Candidatus Electrothrix gigas]